MSSVARLFSLRVHQLSLYIDILLNIMKHPSPLPFLNNADSVTG